MALDKDILGTAIYTRVNDFNNVAIDEADLEDNRLAYWKAVADVVINHFKANGIILVPGQSPGIIE